MNQGLILQLLLSGSFAGVLGAVFNGIINRKKLGAEATNIIQTAAGAQVERLQKEIEDKVKRIAELEHRADAADLREDRLEARIREGERLRAIELRAIRDVLELHAAWDFKVIALLEAHGVPKGELRPPPPLLPKTLDAE